MVRQVYLMYVQAEERSLVKTSTNIKLVTTHPAQPVQNAKVQQRYSNTSLYTIAAQINSWFSVSATIIYVVPSIAPLVLAHPASVSM